jgi:hypothetical protein
MGIKRKYWPLIALIVLWFLISALPVSSKTTELARLRDDKLVVTYLLEMQGTFKCIPNLPPLEITDSGKCVYRYIYYVNPDSTSSYRRVISVDYLILPRYVVSEQVVFKSIIGVVVFSNIYSKHIPYLQENSNEIAGGAND